jgi:dynein assembly factor 2, axonemal
MLIQEDNGSAKFDKAKRQLVITLPVVPEKRRHMTDFHREDSGIESDHQNGHHHQAVSDESDESPIHEKEAPSNKNESTFDSNIDYILPSFTFNQIDDILAFTLHVKNVDPASIVIDRRDLINLAHIKFSSIGSGFFPIHYSFCVKFPSQGTSSIFRDITAEAWDNNVIFQFELNNYNFTSYEAGLHEEALENYDIAERLIGRQAMTSQGKEIEDDSLSIEVRSDKECELVIEVSSNKKPQEMSNDDEISEDVFDDAKSIDVNAKRPTKKSMKKRAKKARSMSESYCDQLKVINELDSLKLESEEPKGGRTKARSVSESSDEEHLNRSGDMTPAQNLCKYKSILKNRYSLSECNESSVDEQSKSLYSISADFGICESHDSLSESCKKQVRFSDIIKRQLFR